MKEIFLTDRKSIVIVDDEDYEELNVYNWHKLRAYGTCYAARYTTKQELANNYAKVVRMHRQIMKVIIDRSTIIDHRNSNGLDNQRTNLRVATRTENNRNTRKLKSITSIYKGVSRDGVNHKWEANITFEGKHYKIGRFDNEKQAAIAYNNKALELYREFANLNTIV